MSDNILWKASTEELKNSNLFKFENFLEENYSIKFSSDYKLLWKWSIDNPGEFWKSIWQFSNIKGKLGNKLIKYSNTFYKNEFLPNSKLNFSENLLTKNDNSNAITFISETGFKEKRSWKDLNANVTKISKYFKNIKIKEKDTIAS